MRRVQGVAHILRDRVYRMTGATSGEPFRVYLLQGGDGLITLQYRRVSDADALIEIGNIKPDGLANVVFGDERILKSELIGSTSETVDNRDGAEEIEVRLKDLFGRKESKETRKSAGTSISATVEASEEIEGVASFKESVRTEAHAEISETEGSETSREDEGEEKTKVPVGIRVKITETRTRADTEMDVTARGKFLFTLAAGKHSGGHWKGKQGRGHVFWSSWQDFEDVVMRRAPDNYDLAESFKGHPPWHADLWVLDPMDSEVRYTVKFEGRVLRDYRVEKF